MPDWRGSMDSETVLIPNGDFVFRDIGEESILVPVRAGVSELDSLFALNEVGAVVWKEVSSGSTARQIVGAVQAEFEIELDVAEKDVFEFLEILLNRDLIRQAEA